MYEVPGPSAREHFIEVCRALSEPIRVDMLSYMATADELPCTFLSEVLPVAKSTISYHIKVLHQAGLITVRKDGRNYHYRLRTDFFERWLPGFLEVLRDDATTEEQALATR